ncbi:MAG: hypothetical protein DKT66_01125 [Candidatus Melainabacteria bacterium]|nr:MAG: hypothetical protein DKT66_01125 [Candidatus Melainabacteria bacterium]
MILEKQWFPGPVAQPLGVSSIVQRSLGTYVANLGFCSKLFLFPAVVSVVSDLPFTLFSHAAHANKDYLSIALIWGWFLFMQIPLYYSCAVRGTIMQRLALLPSEEFVTAAAYANRFWWMRCSASAARDIIQIAGIILLGGLGIAGWSIFGAFSPAFFALAAVLSALMYFTWFSCTFLHMCFSVSVATEEKRFGQHWRSALSLFRRAFWRGSNFQVLLFVPYVVISMLFNPVTLYYLPQIGELGLWGCMFPQNPPLLVALFRDLFSVFNTVVSFPFFYICAAYFIHDLRVRNNLPLLVGESGHEYEPLMPS